MSDTERKNEALPQRLCSEIQLFDLCDLNACTFRNNRFCTNSDMLARFEKIADVEQRAPERYMSDELDDEEDGAEEGYDEDDDELSMDDFEGGEDDGWED